MKTAIIGSGIGGLITALYLSKRGYEVTIFEKNSEAGGRLTFVKNGAYKVDQGPTIILLPDMLKEILKEVGIDLSSLDLVRCDPLYRLHYKTGRSFSKWSDIRKQLAEIEAKFPGEEENFRQYLDDMEYRFTEGKKAFLDRDFVRKRDFWNVPNIQTLWKLKAYQSVQKQAKQYFTHPKMQDAFSFQTLYIGGAPFGSPALYSLVPFSEHFHGVWYLKGGYAHLISLLVRELKTRGVKINFNSKVSDILLQNKRCVGVISNGERFEFERIIYNGDFPQIKELLPKLKQKKPFVPSSGCLLLYFGLSKIYQNDVIHQFFMSDDLERHMKEVFVDKKLPSDPAIYTFHPSVIDESLAPKGHGVLYALVPVPANPDIQWDQIDDYVEKIISEIENRGFPNLREHIVWKQIRTPKDSLADGLYQGGSFGIAPTLTQSGVFRPQIKPFDYENFYVVGASIHPGGGVPIVMQGAKLLVNYLLTEERNESNE
ncbi:phytoene desaturase [Anaerobacillus sp. CMMVII]|uniref:phytoene desaturase family protein n=1 Tax=Anaerobacillus sp. CMMVII TaxID=2755588 RepID=UPI0021B7FE0C|nr:phytoene desaturase family protein [Anaerobacillus sp. CMMVII]MCT8138478.1 phytoene desaturase [Anaerobacillus sp. CMMVII]